MHGTTNNDGGRLCFKIGAGVLFIRSDRGDFAGLGEGLNSGGTSRV